MLWSVDCIGGDWLLWSVDCIGSLMDWTDV
jgi:hypothetical protein